MRVATAFFVPVLAGALVAIAPGAATATTASTLPAAGPSVLGVTLSNNSLISFDVTNPAATGTPVTVTGLNAGDTLVGIDFRPQNGYLYGLGYNSAGGTVQVYSVSYRTGLAAALGTPASFVAADGVTPAPVQGTNFGVDFNPTVDRIRVVSDAGQDFRLNPNNGAAVDGNAAVAGVQMDGPINGATATVDAAAYTNNQQNAAVTTLYTLSAATDQLFIQNPPNNGTQTNPVGVVLNGAPLDFTAANGFDILPGVNASAANAVTAGTGLAALTGYGYTGLYTIDLTTGAATLVGPIGTGSTPVQGFAAQGAVAPRGLPTVALSADGSQLARFDTSGPGAAVTVTVTSLTPGDVLAGIDWRPQTGQLVGLGVNDTANSATLYLLDPQTGAASPVGAAGQIAFVGADGITPVDLPPATAGYGVDFNPTVDRVRVVTNTGLNFRSNPNNGAPVDANTTVNGVQTDGSINGLPGGATGVSGAAYTNSFGQPLTGGVTTQYTVEAVTNTLFIQNPPNNGTQTSGLPVAVGGAPLDFTEVNGFDIPPETMVSASGAPAAGRSFAALTVAGTTSLYQLELGTGSAQVLGPIGTGAVLAGLAVGDGRPDAPAAPATPGFQALTPTRVFDTRPGSPDGLRVVDKRKVGDLYELRVKFTDLPGRVPATGVEAVSLNVTVTEPDAPGFVTVYPCDSRPLASSVNYTASRTVANAVIVPLSANGEACFYSFALTHLLADINGYFPTGSAFSAVSPTRLFDTRPASPDGLRVVDKRKVGGGTELTVQVTDLAGRVPASGVGAVSLNVTSTEQVGNGFVTAYPCGGRPLVSSLNFVAGQDVANAVIVPVSAAGTVCFFAFADTHLLADINGYFPTGKGFAAVSPTRVFDTRPGSPDGVRVVDERKVGGGYELRVQLTDLAGLVPATGVGAVSLNVTATEPDGDGFVTVYPCGARPLASSVNYVAGQTVPNAVITPVSDTGEVCFFAFAPTHLLADINGYFPSAVV